MTNSILNKKIELIQWIATVETISTLKKILAIKDEEYSEVLLKLSKVEKESIEIGLKDAENGNVNSHLKV